MKIYTRKGDSGMTGLIGNIRVNKVHLRIEVIGSIDELNASLGLCKAHCKIHSLSEIIEKLQIWLFDVGAELATPQDHLQYKETIKQEYIELLEKSMDEYTKGLEPLMSFIMPGGSMLASHFHVARTVCRRTERTLFQLHHKEPVREVILGFFNRLSDWLFVAARTANAHAKIEDIKWSGW